jgi:hypothetical protein
MLQDSSAKVPVKLAAVTKVDTDSPKPIVRGPKLICRFYRSLAGLVPVVVLLKFE